MYRYGALDRGQVRWAHLRGVQCKTLKGKKVSVPGKKGKHTIAQDVKCVVGAMGIKIIDGERECTCRYAITVLHASQAAAQLSDVSLLLPQTSWPVT